MTITTFGLMRVHSTQRPQTFSTAVETKIATPSKAIDQVEISATARATAALRAQLQRTPEKIALRSIVISGAGPTGLMAAIAAAKDNPHAKITLVEQRSEDDPNFHQRKVHFAVKQELLNEIAALAPAAYKALLEKSGGKAGLSEVKLIDPSTGEAHRLMKGDGLHTDARAIGTPPELITHSHAVMQVGVADLEQVLFAHLKTLSNIEILTGHQLSFLKQPGDRYAIEAQALIKKDGKRVPSGPKLSLGTPDLVFVAEGVRSESCSGPITDQKLGIARTKTTPKGRYMSGHIQENIGRINHRMPLPNPESKEVLRLGAVGHADPSHGTWLLLQLPSTAGDTPEEAQSWFAKLAKLVTKKETLTIDAKPSPFILQGDVAEKVSAGKNVVIGGDAAGTAHFAQGVGAVLGGTAHCEAFRDLMKMIKVGFPREEALALYEARIHSAVRAWLEPGLKEFYPNVSIDAFSVPKMIDTDFEAWLAEKRAAEGFNPDRPAELEAEELAKYRALVMLRKNAPAKTSTARRVLV